MPAEGTSLPAPLRFDEAAPAESAQAPSCGRCTNPIGALYYEFAGSVLCPACKERLEAELTSGSGATRFLKAAAFGLGGAAVGAGIYYAILALTGYEVGLIAILVGWLVGSAVHRGAGGRGGWVYQSLAVGLTYFAIVSTYIPMIVKGLKDGPSAAAASSQAPGTKVSAEPITANATAPVSAPPAAPKAPVATVSPGRLALALAGLLLIAAAAPFLAGFHNILGLMIISFGLYQAWKLNRKAMLAFTGPYAIGTAGNAARAGE